MIAGLVLGLFGVLHCLGMCGPLVITFTGSDNSKFSFFIYHLGRLVSYILIGIVLGFIGHSLGLIHFQQFTSLTLGLLLLLLYSIPKFRNAIFRYYAKSGINSYFRKLLSRNLSLGQRLFVSGMANGVLPCGLVYVAAAGSIALGGMLEGAFFMLSFGVGTLPIFILLRFGSTFLGSRYPAAGAKAIPTLAMISGAILILRGLLMTFPDFNELVGEQAPGIITICGL